MTDTWTEDEVSVSIDAWGALTLDYGGFRLEINADGDAHWIVMDGEDPLESVHPMEVAPDVRKHLDAVADRILDGYWEQRCMHRDVQGVKL